MSNLFYNPASDEEGSLYITTGTAFEVSWVCNYSTLNLRVFQQRQDGSYTYEDLLSDVENELNDGSYAWSAGTISGLTTAMHFEITEASNDQSLNPFNSGSFIVTNTSDLSISGSSASSGATTTTEMDPTMTSSSVTITTSSSGLAKSLTVERTALPTSAPSSPPKKTNTFGIGLALGLGIPIILMIIAFVISRRRRMKVMQRRVQLKTYELDVEHRVQPQELDGNLIRELDAGTLPEAP